LTTAFDAFQRASGVFFRSPFFETGIEENVKQWKNFVAKEL